MPKETIAVQTVSGDAGVYLQGLHVAWGAKGCATDAPDGWVNAGYAQIQISEDRGSTGTLFGVDLRPDEVDRLIRVLKKIKRKAFAN